ncbi:hypothetical protein [Oceanivirga salmonicida]|uniref:hypothetical protein n=1 Tax=Oceanivirga salmonicida TaxID=1769291 RepID=UPI00083089E8|nr:hypothetical protein [Oceanivirga salmonicida]
MTRTGKIRKNQIKYIIMMILLTVLLLSESIFISYKKLTPNNAITGTYRSVDIVEIGDEVVKVNENFYFIHTLTDNNEIILITSKNKNELLNLKNANENNIIEFKGKLLKLRDTSIKKLKEIYINSDNYIYEYSLNSTHIWDRISVGKIFEIIFFAGLALVFIIAFIKNKKVFQFLKESEYNTKEATLKFNKYTEIVDNILFELRWGQFIDLNLYDKFRIEKRKFLFFTTHIMLDCFSKNGNKKIGLSRMNDEKIKILAEHLKLITEKVEVIY